VIDVLYVYLISFKLVLDLIPNFLSSHSQTLFYTTSCITKYGASQYLDRW